MLEGWNGDDYLILFEESELSSAETLYNLAKFLPGFQIIGLRSWDDFIVRDSGGHTYSVPTVPVDKQYLEPFALPSAATSLNSDKRFSGRIKWYVKPLVFGGDPSASDNLTWVTHEQHGKLVQHWNEKYRSLHNKKA